MNIIVAGIIGRYPYGGVAWCSLMYLLGLRRLGHRVWYLEDTGECNFDPIANTLATEPTYATRFIVDCLRPHGLDRSWCYVDYRGVHHGIDRAQWHQVCRDADLFINLSGGCWFWRDEYAEIPNSAFIDSDPAFTQLAIAKGPQWYKDFFLRHGALFTFGSNVGTSTCDVPVNEMTWIPTWQPVVMDEWQPVEDCRPIMTTIMSWVIGSFSDIGGNKDREFAKVLDLPSRVRTPLELALSTRPPQEALRKHGWKCRDAFDVSNTLDAYRNYIRTSMGEFSVAKHTYVRTNSGWFSDRTECYLASGRPAVVQDTGFSRHIPVGEGLCAYQGADEAAAAIDTVAGDWSRHSRAAREVAREYFDSDRVLRQLLDRSTTRAAPSERAAIAAGA